MAPSEQEIQWMDRYLKGTLDGSERAEFERRCQEDPDFAEAVRLHTLAEFAIRKGAEAQKRTQYQEAFDAWYDQQTTPVRKISYQPLWLAAAAAVLLLIAIGIFFNPFAPDSPDRLYRDFVEVPAFSTVRGQDTAPWPEARAAYREKDYEQVIRLLEPIYLRADHPDFDKAAYFTGIAYLQIDAYGPAAKALQSVSPTSGFGEAAQWYLALCLLAQGEIASCTAQLQTILANSSHFQHAAATRLLDQLQAMD